MPCTSLSERDPGHKNAKKRPETPNLPRNHDKRRKTAAAPPNVPCTSLKTRDLAGRRTCTLRFCQFLTYRSGVYAVVFVLCATRGFAGASADGTNSNARHSRIAVWLVLSPFCVGSGLVSLLLFSIATKWLLLGCVRECEVPVFSVAFRCITSVGSSFTFTISIGRANSTKIPSPRIDPRERPADPGWTGKEGKTSGIKNEENPRSVGPKNPLFFLTRR